MMRIKIVITAILLCYVFSLKAQLPNYVPTSGLLSFYELDGNLNDLGPANQPFNAIGTASYGLDRQSNSNSSAVTLRSPLLSYLSNTLPANKPTSVSFAMWFRPTFTTPASQFPIIGGMRSNTTVLNSWLFYMTQGNALNFGYSTSGNGNNQNLNCNTTLAENTWYHLVATFSNADGLKVFVNGVQVASAPATGNLVYNANSNLVLGNTGASVPGLGDQAAGLNDEVGYWNRVLTIGEIQALFTSTPPCVLSKNITGNTQYCAGNTINLTAAFTLNSGQSITAYQWKRNGANLTNGGKVSGATTANLQVTNFALSDTGTYRVVVTTSCGVDSFQVNVRQGTQVNISDLTTHYPFNTNENDVSGNGYNATATATTNVANRFGQANSAFSFNGTSSVVEIAAPTGQTILGNGQNKSVSLWFKRGSTTSGGVLVSYQQATPGNWNALAYIGNDGVLRGWMFQGGSAPWSSGVVMDTNWHHLALVYTTNNQTAYLDGAVVASLSGTPNPGSSNVIRIGNGYATTGAPGISVTGNQPFLGLIDEVRFYNKAVNTSDINALLSDPISITSQPQLVCAIIGSSATFTIGTQGAVSYQWQKNGVNISGATSATYTINSVQASDLANYRCVVTSICDNTVSLTSSAASLASIPASPQPTRIYSLGSLSYDDGLLVGSHHATAVSTNFNTAVPDRFNLVNGALRRSSGSVIAPLRSIDQPNTTISFWVNLNNFGAGTRAFLGGANNNLPYHLMANGNQLYFQTNSGITFVNANLPTTGWAHVAVVYQGNTNTFYVNGQQTFTTTTGINLSTNPIQSLMGLNTATSADYLADDLRVFESALTATQIEGVYANGEAVPHFAIAPIDEHACVGGTIQFRFRQGVDNGIITVKKNGVDLPAGGNVTITDSSVVIANATPADFTNYTINLRKGCASVEKTVSAVQLPATFYNNGLVRHYRLNNSTADELGGAALTASGTYVVDRYGQGTRAFRKINNSNVQMPQITASPFTLSYWMNFYGGGSFAMVSELGTTGVNVYKFGNGVGFDLGQLNGQPYGFNNVNVLQPTQWRMVTVTHDGSYCKIYVDDLLITQFRPINNSVSLRDFFPSQSIDLDDIRVYSRALSEAEVKGLYRLPDIGAGTPAPNSICVGQTLNLSVTGLAFSGVNVRYQWTFNGNPISNGGNVSGANTANLQITNAQVSNQGAYNCIVIGECTEVTSTTFNITVGAGNVSVTQQPQSQSVCPGSSATFSVATQGAAVTYQWKRNGVNINGATSATLVRNNVSLADTGSYTVDIIGGSCGTISSQAAVLTLLPAPLANISPATVAICNGQSTTLTASGGTTYAWSNGGGSNAAATFFPATTTTYTVTVTNANNCSATASRQVTVNANPTASISPATASICESQSATLTASGGGTYAWSNSGGSNAAATFSPTSTTTYTVTVTNANNCTATASRQVSVNANPTASISPATVTICNGESATLTASGGGTYAWSNSGGSNAQATFSPTSTTTYTVTVTNAANCSATASRQVTVNANPTAGISPATSAICQGGSQTLTASGGTSYNWSNSLGTGASKSVSPTQTSTYTVTVTNAANCTATANATVTVNPIPNAAINGPTTICSGLSATLTAGGGNSYAWSNSETTTAITVSPTSTTNYTVTVTGTGNCTATASQTISVQSAPTATISGNTTICNGESTTLTANGGNSYVWSNNQTTAAVTVSPTATTTYTVTVSIGANCTASESVTVTVNQPSALTQLTETICQGSSYTFDGNALTQSNTYTAIFTNAAGCDSTVELTLNVTPANVTRLDTTVCDGATINFFSQTITQAGLYTETLQTTAGCDSIVELSVVYLNPISTTVNAQICVGQTYEFDGQQLNQSNTYTATFTSAQGCDSTVTLNLSVVSEITETVNASICDGESYAFDGQQLTIADTYTATFLSAGGCDSVVTLNLTVNPLPQPTVTANNANLSTEAFATYQWQLNGNDIQGADQQNYTAIQNGDYSVKVTDANGCENTSSAVNVTIVSVANYNLGFTVYPNPTTGIINIETAINNAEISIIALEGKVLFSQKATNKTTAIDMSSLAHGMYIIEMKAENTISRLRVVKE